MFDSKFSVLVVEDEKLIARDICRSIKRVNNRFEVVSIASNGADALAATTDLLPNVVITDIRMPVMDGLELAKRINEKYDFIYCVILSGYNDFSYAKEAIHQNVVDYLLKPINDKELANVLNKIEIDLIALQKSLDVEDDSSFQKPDEIVDLVLKYIHMNYMDLLDLREIADKFGFSTSYLSKIFTRETGKSPSKYIRDHRICLAKQLLRNQDLSIAIIGQKVGYPDQFHFSKVFKQASGLSPSEYRISYVSQNTQSG